MNETLVDDGFQIKTLPDLEVPEEDPISLTEKEED
jgi:hypothetical protein